MAASAAAVVRRRFWPFWCGESHRGTQNGPLWTTSLDQPLVGQKERTGDLTASMTNRSSQATLTVRRTQRERIGIKLRLYKALCLEALGLFF